MVVAVLLIALLIALVFYTIDTCRIVSEPSSRWPEPELLFPNPNEFRGYGPPSKERDQRILQDMEAMREAARQIEEGG